MYIVGVNKKNKGFIMSYWVLCVDKFSLLWYLYGLNEYF